MIKKKLISTPLLNKNKMLYTNYSHDIKMNQAKFCF